MIEHMINNTSILVGHFAANPYFNPIPMLHIPALGLHIPLQPWMVGPVQWIMGQLNNLMGY